MTEPVYVRCDRTGPVLHIRLACGDAGNPLTHTSVTQLRAAFDLCQEEHIRACTLLADGRHFSTGGDHDEVARMDESRLAEFRAGIASLFAAIAGSPVPIVTGVQGAAIGGGCQLALLGDVVVASQSARFQLPQAQLGLAIESAAVQALVARCGLGLARRMVLLSEPIPGPEAFDRGLVDFLAPDDALDARAGTVAAHLARLSPRVVGRLRSGLDHGAGGVLNLARDDAQRRERAVQRGL